MHVKGTRRLHKRLLWALMGILVLSACNLLPFGPSEPETCETNPSAETCPDPEPDGEAEFTLTNTADAAEVMVGDSLSFTVIVENIGEETGSASLSVKDIAGLDVSNPADFETQGLNVDVTLKSGEEYAQTITGTVSEDAGKRLSALAELDVAASGNTSKAASVKVVQDDVTPPEPEPSTQGAVILTFDDNFVDNWLDAHETLSAYDWRATFFITGAADAIAPRGAGLNILQTAGHEIGAHTVEHRNILEYLQQTGETVGEYIDSNVLPNKVLLEEEGLTIDSFAYANGARNLETDEALLDIFTNLRGITGAQNNPSFAGASFYATEPGLTYGLGIDEYPAAGADIDYILEALAYAKESDQALVMYAHDIVTEAPTDPNGLAVSFERLEQIVKYVDENEMAFLTLGDLETWKSSD